MIWAYNSKWWTRSDCENLVDSWIESWLFLCTPLVTRCLFWQTDTLFFSQVFYFKLGFSVKSFLLFLKVFPQVYEIVSFLILGIPTEFWGCGENFYSSDLLWISTTYFCFLTQPAVIFPLEVLCCPEFGSITQREL